MAFLSALGTQTGLPHTDFISFLYLDKNNLPSVFASVLLRPQPLRKPEWCNVKQRPHLFHFLNSTRRAILIHLNDPSKLASFLSFGRAPMLVYVRPSNACPLPILSEGAGIVSTARIEGPPLYRGASASTETSQLSRSRSSASKKSGEGPR